MGFVHKISGNTGKYQNIPENTGKYRKILGNHSSLLEQFVESAEYFDTLFYHYRDWGISETEIVGQVMKFLKSNVFPHVHSQQKPLRKVLPNLFRRYEYWVGKIFGTDSLKAVKQFYRPWYMEFLSPRLCVP